MQKLAAVNRKSKKEVREKRRTHCASDTTPFPLLWIRASNVPLAAKPKRAILITM